MLNWGGVSRVSLLPLSSSPPERLVAVRLDSEVNGGPFSGTFFSARPPECARWPVVEAPASTHHPLLTVGPARLYQRDKEMCLISHPPLLTSSLRGQSHLNPSPFIYPSSQSGPSVPDSSETRTRCSNYSTSLTERRTFQRAS